MTWNGEAWLHHGTDQTLINPSRRGDAVPAAAPAKIRKHEHPTAFCGSPAALLHHTTPRGPRKIMTALMPDRTRPSAAELRRDLRHRRPLVLLAPLAGAAAAASTLTVCMALGVTGWFLTDAGAHGTPRDGLWVGALAWLMAHGSGVHVGGALVSAMPLGITLVCGWATWRIGHRLGDSISGHGPDAQRIAGPPNASVTVVNSGKLHTFAWIPDGLS